ncbi:MAG TPA: DUF2231 domain-containing protein [Pseudonocardiaceae bacterium]
MVRSRVRVAGHAAHPMLIVFPLGLLGTAVVFDILHLLTDRGGFATTAAHLLAAGVLSGLLAAATGWADWLLAVPRGTRARQVGLLHGLANGAMLVLFAISWLLRFDTADWTPSWPAIVLAWAGVVLALASGWLGGELVERHGIGVEEDAHPDAEPSFRRGSTTRTTR